MESVLQLVTVFLIFILVLVITYYSTRFIAKQQQAQVFNKNIKVIETFRVTQNKFIQIIRVGEKYLVIAVCKDTITMLTELSKEEVDEAVYENGGVSMTDGFKELLEKARKNVLKK